MPRISSAPVSEWGAKKLRRGFRELSCCRSCDNHRACFDACVMRAGCVPDKQRIFGEDFSLSESTRDKIRADIAAMYAADSCKHYYPKKG